MVVDKTKALTLQAQGCKYKEIANALGCSVSWCKNNLRSSTKVKAAKAAKAVEPTHQYAEMVAKSLSNDALTNKELHTWLWSKMQPLDTSSEPEYKQRKEEVADQAKEVKRLIRDKSDGVIRPSWMLPSQAKYSISLLCEIADVIEMRVQEEVIYMAHTLGLSDDEIGSIRYDLMRILNSKTALMHTNAVTELERLNGIADVLELRNGIADKVVRELSNRVWIDEKDIPY